MMKRAMSFIIAMGVLVGAGELSAQPQARAKPQAPPQQPPAEAQLPAVPIKPRPNIPLRVQLTISSYQGEKKISSVPYSLSVNAVPAGHRTQSSQLRMGSRVPVPSQRESMVDGKPVSEIPGMMTGPISFRYENTGTMIDCSASYAEDGRYELTIAIEDTSMVTPDTLKGASKPGDPPVFRTFSLNNQVILRDGQSTQFSAATDRISGDVIRVDVALTVPK